MVGLFRNFCRDGIAFDFRRNGFPFPFVITYIFTRFCIIQHGIGDAFTRFQNFCADHIAFLRDFAQFRQTRLLFGEMGGHPETGIKIKADVGMRQIIDDCFVIKGGIYGKR